MGIFGRIGEIFKDNVTGGWPDKMEDPEITLRKMFAKTKGAMIQTMQSLRVSTREEKILARDIFPKTSTSKNQNTQKLIFQKRKIKTTYTRAKLKTRIIKRDYGELIKEMRVLRMKESTLKARNEMARARQKNKSV